MLYCDSFGSRGGDCPEQALGANRLPWSSAKLFRLLSRSKQHCSYIPAGSGVSRVQVVPVWI